MTTTMPLPTDTPTTGSDRARRFVRSFLVLLVFLGVGTYLVHRVVAFDPIESAINGLVWCPGDDASMRSNGRSSGSQVRTNGDSLVCRRDGQVVREVSIPAVMLTDLAVSAGVTLSVMTVGIGSLMAVGRHRRHRRMSGVRARAA